VKENCAISITALKASRFFKLSDDKE